MDGENRKKIQAALLDCGKASDFARAVGDLLSELGYNSKRTDDDLESTPKAFIKEFPARHANTKSEKRFTEAVKSVHLLFQYTSEEIEEACGSLGLDFGDVQFDINEKNSFVFLAVELRKSKYRRGDYADFTREINKRLDIPAVVIFRCGNAGARRVTLSFVWRRESITESDYDVLGRVSLLREIECDGKEPHRGHVNILTQLTLEKRMEWMRDNGEPMSFKGLHAAWLDELDAEALNRRFYKDLREWFDRAIKAKFPKGKVTPRQQVVRMIGRLLFIWFMKEKKLVSEDLFNERYIRGVLVECDQMGDSYYRAILQNLFFATLNTEIDKRNFSSVSKKTHRDSSLYRYKDLMKKPKEILDIMRRIPFVNGGLFDCLDDFDAVNAGGKRVDCFTDNPTQRKQLSVPNSLFFGDKGVFEIFNKYKFTVEENTPIEQEVALDPELLGKVFEEFLGHATLPKKGAPIKKSDRKKTGSYYTPRVIVDYMVRESLAVYFAEKIEGDKEYLQEKIRDLLSAEVEYDALPDDEKLNESEIKQFVMTVSDLRLLDPAVGSGAFLMGALQQMTMALLRVDPDNKFLRERELKVARQHKDDDIRKNAIAEVNRIFAKKKKQYHYARKLSLIRDCLFGVDIQTIAVQICRLRFFISLLIEQDIEPKKENFGIIPLPNTDTKIIAANTLIGLAKTGEKGQIDFSSGELQKRRDNIRDIRRKYFNAKARDEKKHLIEEDRKASMELAKHLSTILYGDEDERVIKDAYKIAAWDLYDQNAKADWFDAKWMFNIDDGFDVVIGNPPYINVENLPADFRGYLFEHYETCSGRTDIYIAFLECALQLTSNNGIIKYIIPYAFTNQKYGKPIRKLLVAKHHVKEIVDTSEYLVFEQANVKNIILQVWSNPEKGKTTIKHVTNPENFVLRKFDSFVIEQRNFLNFKDCRFETKNNLSILVLQKKLSEENVKLTDVCFIGYGARLNHKNKPIKKEAYIFDEYQKGFVPYHEGRNIERYAVSQSGWLQYESEEHYNPMFRDLFENEKMVTINVVKDRIRFAFDKNNFYNSHTVINVVKWHLLTCVEHVSVRRNLSKQKVKDSEKYSYLFLLAVVNSNLLNWYFKAFLSEKLHFYPDDVKSLPIPRITRENAEIVAKVEELANSILAAKEADANADTTETEAEIDKLVYDLYKLSPEERTIVEANQ